MENITLRTCNNYESKRFKLKKQEYFLPYNVWIEITNTCNLKCKMCGQRGDHGYFNDPDSKMWKKNLPIEEWTKFIDNIKSFNPMIVLRGGEPLLYPQIVEFMQYVKESNLYLIMDTNGTQMKRYAYELAKYIDHINISIDGPPEVHDYVRGVKGTYEIVREGIVEYNKAWKNLKGKKRASPLSINCTVSVDNYHAIPEMINVAKDLDIKEVTLSLAYYFDANVGKEYELAFKNKFGLDAISWRGFFKNERNMDYELLIKNINEVLHNNNDVRFSVFPSINDKSIQDWFKDTNIPVSYDRCYSPWYMVNVMPNGDVNFCCDFGDYIIGNITQEPLLDMWFNNKALKFREEIMNERFSICKRCGVKQLFPLIRLYTYRREKIRMKVLKFSSKIPLLKKKVLKYNGFIKSI